MAVDPPARFPFFEGEGEWYVLNNLVVAWINTRYLDEPGRSEVRRHVLAAYKAARRMLREQRRLSPPTR